MWGGFSALCRSPVCWSAVERSGVFPWMRHICAHAPRLTPLDSHVLDVPRPRKKVVAIFMEGYRHLCPWRERRLRDGLTEQVVQTVGRALFALPWAAPVSP